MFIAAGGLIALLFVVAAGFLGWLFLTEPGLRWAIERAESATSGKLKVQGARGTLAGMVSIAALRFEEGGTRIEARDVAGRAHLAAALGGRLVVEPLRIGTLDVKLGAGGKGEPPVPRLPLGTRVGELEIGRLTVEQGGARHVVSNIRFAHVALGAGLPPGVSAEGAFDFEYQHYALTVALTAAGSLDKLQVHLRSTVEQITGEVRAVVTPFHSQKIESIEARAGPFDLARFNPELPHTAFGLALRATERGAGFAGTLSASNSASGPIDKGRLPVAGVEARFSTGDLKSVALEDLRIALAGGGALEGRGVASAAGFDGRLQASRLDLRALRSTLRETRLSGPLELALARDAQTVRGSLSQPGMSVNGEAVRRGDEVDVRRLHLSAGGGELQGSGRLRLGEPLAFEAKLALSRFNPAAFGDFPPGQISGTLDAKGDFGKELRSDLRWALKDSNLYDQTFQSEGSARLTGRRLQDVQASAALGEARATARGTFGGPGDRLAWTLEVPRLQEHVEGVSGRMKATGTLGGSWSEPNAAIEAHFQSLELPRGLKASSARAELGGTLARHAGQFLVRIEGTDIQARLAGGLAGRQWTGEIQALEANGRVPFILRAPASLKASPQRVELGYVAASVGEGRLLIKELTWSKERMTTVGEFSGVPAQWIITAGGWGQRVRSTLLLDGQWQVAASPKLDGSVRVRRTGGDLVLVDEREVELELQGLALDARITDAGIGARLDVSSRYATAAIAAQLGRDPAAGAIGLGPDSPLLVNGQVELASARVFAQPWVTDLRVDGRVGADLAVTGTLGKPLFGGTLRGDALALDYPPFGVYLKNGELRAKIQNDRLDVERFAVQAGEGRFIASGSLPLRFADGNAKLAWQARNFALLERPDMRLITSGEGEVGFDGKRLSLGGELRADRGHLEIERERVPKLGDDVVIAGETRPPPRDQMPLPLALNIDLDLGSNLTVHMQGLEGKLAGRINVSTTPEGELRAHGKLYTVNATFFAYGQRLQVDPGVLIFDGPVNNPTLQITAWRKNQAVEAGVQISGTALAPRVQIVSQPAVSEGERLSWLVLGRAPSDATKADLGMLQAAAGALLARGDSMPLDRRIARSFGLDEVSFRGSGEVQDRVLAFGKRLSDRLYVSYEQGLGTVASNLVKLDYSLSRRWSVRAETGTSSGWGLFYRFSWD